MILEMRSIINTERMSAYAHAAPPIRALSRGTRMVANGLRYPLRTLVRICSALVVPCIAEDAPGTPCMVHGAWCAGNRPNVSRCSFHIACQQVIQAHITESLAGFFLVQHGRGRGARARGGERRRWRRRRRWRGGGGQQQASTACVPHGRVRDVSCTVPTLRVTIPKKSISRSVNKALVSVQVRYRQEGMSAAIIMSISRATLLLCWCSMVLKAVMVHRMSSRDSIRHAKGRILTGEGAGRSVSLRTAATIEWQGRRRYLGECNVRSHHCGIKFRCELSTQAVNASTTKR